MGVLMTHLTVATADIHKLIRAFAWHPAPLIRTGAAGTQPPVSGRTGSGRLGAAWLAAALMLVASCGDPSVDIEVTAPPDLTALGPELEACVRACDIARQGSGCASAGAIQLGEPCLAGCVAKVRDYEAMHCLGAAHQAWQCAPQVGWKCVGLGEPPTATGTACAAPQAALASCVDNAPAKGDAVSAACSAWCRQEADACGHVNTGPHCRQDCEAKIGSAKPSACSEAMAALMACQAADLVGWSCDKSGQVAKPPAPADCPDEKSKLDTCLGLPARGSKDLFAARATCGATCASVGAAQASCKVFAAGACLDECESILALPPECAGAAKTYWNCMGAATLTCDGASVTSGCTSAKAALELCVKTGSTTVACAPNTEFCDGDLALHCKSGGNGTSVIEDCAATKKLCKADKGYAKCYTPCTSTGVSCSGSKVVECLDGVLTTVEDCAYNGLPCQAGKCWTGVECTPGTYKCTGTTLEKCNSKGNSWTYMDTCNDSSACAPEKCSAEAGKCQVSYKPEGSACTLSDPCFVSAACTSAGSCVGSKAADCNDGIDCTVDSCKSYLGCNHVYKDSLCSDGEPCTADDCQATGCEYPPAVANCSGVAAEEGCYSVKYVGGDWADAEQVCVKAGGHLASINSKATSKLLGDEVWQVGSSAWIGVKWTDGKPSWADGTPFTYNGLNGSVPATGVVGGLLLTSGAWNWADLQAYHTWGVCKIPSPPIACNDNNPCTSVDVCSKGTCVGSGQACDDANACTLDLCDPATATNCSHKPVPSGVSCDDGQQCTKGESCAAGACGGGGSIDCDDGNPCTVDSCADPGGCQHGPVSGVPTCGPGLVCLAGKCDVAGTCGDGKVNNAGEQCDDGNKTAGDGCAATCKVEALSDCAALLKKWPSLADGLYDIDPDGNGPQPSLEVFCHMSDGGWTLVANVYDSAGDDVPNLPEAVTSGWETVASGQWQPPVTIARAATDTGSAVAPLAWVASWPGTAKIRLCLVAENGKDSVCRESPLGVVVQAQPADNPLLKPYAGSNLAWTYGRLIGLPQSTATFDTTKLSDGAGPVAVLSGFVFEFGENCANQAKESFAESTKGAGWSGVWCAACHGLCFRPASVDDDELGVGALNGNPPQANPTATTWGFRIYLKP